MRFLTRRKDGTIALIQWKKSGQLPKYAILSHTWQADDTLEITYEDIQERRPREHKVESYKKLTFAIDRATGDGLDYIWIDTCCIDRTNAVELQEAIASMFRWYQSASKCYAYLSDVSVDAQNVLEKRQQWMSQLETSRWFQRSWTLQELLAPTSVEFFSIQGARLGDRRSLQETISMVTEIPKAALRGTPLDDFTVDERLSWANGRHATRVEDEAYALCGLFGVFIVLVYGEEKESAFKRLRQEIGKLEHESSLAYDALSSLPESQQAAFDSFQRQYDPVCLPGTRIELLSQIQQWIHDPGGLCVFWLSGLPGTGKSTIARTVARHCKSDQESELGGSFFFSGGNSAATSAERVFTTIAKQLASTIPSLRRHICSAVKEHPDIAGKSLQDQWEQLIVGPLSQLKHYAKPIVLVLDALDECDNQKDVEIVLHLLATTANLPELRLRVFFTSRPSPVVQSCFEELPETNRKSCQLHKLRSETIDADLKMLFEDNLYRVRRQRKYDKAWPSSNLISRLVRLSYGLFIWAKVACSYISEGKLAKRRADRLAQGEISAGGPSEHLDQLYITVLTEASKLEDVGDEEEREASRQMTRTVLGSIIILKSQLSVNALANLLEIDPEDVKVSLSYLHTVIDVPENDNQDIRLHHPTFREFMLDSTRCSMPQFVIDQKQAHRDMAIRCTELMAGTLTYNMCRLKSPGVMISSTDREKLLRRYLPIELQYAILEWSEHYRRSGRYLEDDDSAHQFILSHALHWMEAACIMNRQSEMAAAIRTYQILLRSHNTQHTKWVSDMRRMMFSFSTKASETPLQLYCSALAFLRPSNVLRQHFWTDLHPIFKRLKVVQPYGPEAQDDFNYVNDLVFSPDGRKIATGSLNDCTRVWNVAEMKHSNILRGTDKVSSVSISSDGKLLAFGADDSTIHVYDLKNNEIQHVIKDDTGWINSIAFSPDNSVLVSGCSGELIRTWSPVTGQLMNSFEPGLGCINSLSFHPKKGSSLVALGGNDPVIHFFDIDQTKTILRLEGHEGPVSWVRFSHDGRRLVSGSNDCTARVWDTVSGDCIVILKGHEQKVWTSVFSNDMQTIATGSEDKTIKLWSSIDGQLIDTIDSHTSGISAIAFSPDDELLAAVAFNDEVRLWNAKDRTPYGKLPDFIEDLKTNSEEGHEEHNTAHASGVTCLATSQDGEKVASASSDGKIKVWTNTGEWSASLDGHRSEIHHLVFSSDAELIASSSATGLVSIWEVGTGKELHNLDGHKGHVQKMRFSCNNALLVTCATDNVTKMWTTKTGQLCSTLDNHLDTVNDCSFSLDDSMLLTCSSDKSVGLWKIEPDSFITTLRWHKEVHEDSVNSVEFSSDAKLILTAGSDKLIKIWNLDGELQSYLEHHDEPVKCAAFSQDMERIVSTSGKAAVLSNIANKTLACKIDTRIPVNYVRFSDDGECIDTERGRLRIPSKDINVEHITAQMHEAVSLSKSSAKASTKKASDGHSQAVFVTEDWVTSDSQDVLWLPNWQQADCVVVIENKAMLGHNSGALTFLELQS